MSLFPIILRKAGFSAGGREILSGVDLTLQGDGVTALLGPNGAGKSVLLRLIAGLAPSSGGEIAWGGAPKPGPGVALMFQQPALLRDSVAANVAIGLKPLGLSRAETRERIEKSLSRVGLLHRARDRARRLSGGERQRLALARAWAVAPRLLLLDEPTAALDPTATEAIEQLIRQMRSDGARILFSTHNLGQAQRLSDDILFLADGKLREYAPTQKFFAKPQSEEARLFIHGELPWRIAFAP